MKLTALLLTAICLQASAAGWSQTVTLSVKNAPLDKVLKQISKQTGYEFLYNSDMMDKATKVNIEVQHVTLQQALAICFANQPLTWSIIDQKTIVVKIKSVPELKTNPPASIEIRGRVFNEKGQPVAGATIILKGANMATTTDNDGNYYFRSVEENAVLIISYVGYETQQVAVRQRTVINISLSLSIKSLDETVVIGYGTQNKRELTGSISKIKSAEITVQPVTSFTQALQGKAPGLEVVSGSGTPGSNTVVRIRGINSVFGGNDPLFIIDGIPLVTNTLNKVTASMVNSPSGQGFLGGNSAPGSSGSVDYGQDPLSLINPADIESVEILKDAAATAIYGSRASNGVVLISTKRGSQGKSKTDINAYYGVGRPTRLLPVLNTQEYLMIRKEAFANDGIPINATTAPDIINPDSTINTDWQKIIFNSSAPVKQISANVSGGSNTTKVYLSGSFRDESTIINGDFGLQRGSIRFNADHAISDKVKIAITSAFAKDLNKGIRDGGQTEGYVTTASILPPNVNPYNPDGGINERPSPSNLYNPLLTRTIKMHSNTSKFMANASLSYVILPSLILKGDFSYDFNFMREDAFYPLNTNFGGSDRRGQSATTDVSTYAFEPGIHYKTNWQANKLELMAGSTLQGIKTNSNGIIATGFPSDLLQYVINASTVVTPTPNSLANGSFSTSSQYGFSSLFGRLLYSYRDAWLLSAVVRRDGSSRFGDNKKFGTFWSLGAGWIFTKEAFMDHAGFLSFGKLKLSYGVTGNDQIGDFGYLSTINGLGATYSSLSALALDIARPANENLNWERTTKFDIGIDLSFFKNKLELSYNYFDNRTSNLLFNKPLTAQTGYTSVNLNLDGLVQNKGHELQLDLHWMNKKALSWTSKFTFTSYKNKLVRFFGEDYSAFPYEEGQPLTAIWGLKFLGVDPATGLAIYDDHNNDGVISSPGDRYVVTSGQADFSGGFQNVLQYKNFSLDFSLSFVQGMDKLSNIFAGRDNAGAAHPYNQRRSVLNRWQKPGDITNEPKVSTVNSPAYRNNVMGVGVITSRYISDGSFIRMRNITLAYNIPKKIVQNVVENIRVYCTGQNVFTITQYEGYDPEGLGNSLPAVKMFIFGIHLAF